MRKIIFSLAAVLCSMSMLAETFIKVTDAATLQDGDKVVMGCAAKGEVSAGFSSTYKYLDGVTATFQDDKATVENPKVITLKKNGSYWNLYLGSKVIGHNSGSSDLDGQKCRYTTNFAISFEANGTANIVSQTPGDKNAEVFFNHHTTSSRFSLYKASSNQLPIALYKLDESTIPEVVPTSVELNKSSLDLRVGDVETLTATVKPAEAEDKTVAWGTTDANVAAVVNGTVTAVAEGTAKIWVKATAAENVSDTCVVTVLPAAAEGSATYNAVQDAAYLPEGAKVFFGTIKDGENYVMGQYVSGNNIKGTAATYGENRHSVTAPLQVAYTVHIEDGKYMFVDHDGKYLRTISSSKLGSGENDTYAKWTLGEINEDDATVVLTATNGKGIYNNFQGTNDLFNIYESVGDGSYLAKIVLYSDQAPAWVNPEKNPSMVASGDALTIEGDVYTLDWGKQEMDETSHDWGDSRKFTITVTDLAADVEVTLDQTGEEFYCGWVASGIKKDRTTPAEITVYWEATSKGVYTGTLRFHTATEGVADIVVNLRAEAVDQTIDPEYQPTLTLSTHEITLNPNYEEECSDDAELSFSATNLAKALYIKWEHPSSVLFQYAYENDCMGILVGNNLDALALNGSLQYAAGEDYTDVPVLVYVSNLTSEGSYSTKMHFYSLKADSKTENAIDEYVTIHINMTSQPQGIEDVTDGAKARKIVRDGQILIIRNGETFSITGARVP